MNALSKTCPSCSPQLPPALDAIPDAAPPQPLLFFPRKAPVANHDLTKKLPNKNLGVSNNRGTPKWMVKIMENPIKMDDLGVPLFLECHPFGIKTTNLFQACFCSTVRSSSSFKRAPCRRHSARSAASCNAALQPWPREPPPTAWAASPNTP